MIRLVRTGNERTKEGRGGKPLQTTACGAHHAVLAVHEFGLGLFARVMVVACPAADLPQEGDEFAALVVEVVLHARGNLGKLLAPHEAVGDHFLERCRKHRVGDAVEVLLDFSIAKRTGGKKQAQNARLPTAAHEIQSVFKRAAQVFGEFGLIHKTYRNGVPKTTYRVNPRQSRA